MFKDNINLSNNFQDNLQILRKQQEEENNQYLTNFYKNKCDQLQEQVNYLKQIILEVQKPIKRKTEKVIVTGAETPEGEYIPVLQGYYASGKGSKRGRQVEFDPGNAIPKETKQSEIHHAVELARGEDDADNIYTTGKPIEVLRSSIATFKHSDRVDPRTRKIRGQRQLGRKSPASNRGRIM